MSIDDQAKALSNDLFTDDPEIIRLKKVYEDAKKREALVFSSYSERHKLGEKIQLVGLRARHTVGAAGKDALFTAALDDIAGGDSKFTKAMDVYYQIEDAKAIYEITMIAAALAQSNIPSLLVEKVKQDVLDAHNRLGYVLLEKKRAYLQEHPDALVA